jgi:hypothetical protein
MPFGIAQDAAVLSMPAGDQAVNFDVTLAVADTSEILFTVPVGKKLRSFSVANRSGSKISAHISMVAGAAATTGDAEIERKDSWAEGPLELAEGDYEFIGSAGDQPRVTGVAWVSDA